MTANALPGFRPSLSIPLLLCCSYAIAFTDRALVAVAGAPIKHDLGLSDSEFGLLHGTAFVALFCLAGIPLGWLADRYSRKAIIVGGMLFWTAMTFFCGIAGSFQAFLFARIGVGLGEACLLPAGMSLLGGVMPKSSMARGVAVFLMGATIGNAVALLAGGFLLNLAERSVEVFSLFGGHLAPWQLLFVMACPPGFIVAGLLLAIREPRRESSTSNPWIGLGSALAHMRTNVRAYGFLTAATACNVALAQSQAAWMPQFYVRRFELSPGDAAMLIGYVFLASAPLGQWLGGLAIDKLQQRGVSAPANTVLSLCIGTSLPLTATLFHSHDLSTSTAIYGLLNFVIFAGTPAGLAGWQLLTPPQHRGTGIAVLVSIVTMIGVGLGPLSVGLLTQYGFRNEQALPEALSVLLLATGALGMLLAISGRSAFARVNQSAMVLDVSQ